MPPNRKPCRTPAFSRLSRLSALLMLMPASGCTTLTSFREPPMIIDTTCQVFGATVAETGRPALPLKYHSTDAADTKAGARAVNRAYASLCPEAGQ